MKAKHNRDLKILMMDLRMNQTALAEKSGVPRSTLNAIVNGRLVPSDQQEEKIAAAVGKSSEEIFG